MLTNSETGYYQFLIALHIQTMSPISFNNIPLKYPYICNYKWETPTPRHHLSQMLQLPPIEAAGKL
jgi:hypothetical protein